MRINNNWHPDMPEEYRNQIVTGDARILAERIPDESIDLIFTDPVYDRIDDYRWLAEMAVRVLKPSKSILAFCPHVMFEAGVALKEAGLQVNPLLGQNIPMPHARMFKYSLQMNYLPCLWASKGNPTAKWQRVMNLPGGLPGENRGHKWGKDSNIVRYRLMKFTQPNDIVLDTYTGGGTVPAVCKMLGRNYVAFEIDPDTAEKARERVQNTQPPLFVLEPEQMDMKLE